MLSLEHLESIRKREIEMVLPLIRPGSVVLEIGAGAGWQARILADHRCSVSAIDVPGGYYDGNRVWEIVNYDGVHIPFPDASFDVVFSSNVLEHIPDIEAFLTEIGRVLKAEGVAIHMLPSGNWRWWSNLTYYPFLLREILTKLRGGVVSGGDHERPAAPRSFGRLVKRLFIAPRHGEQGNALSEIYSFSRFRWSRLFRATGWEIERYFPNHLFYTGYSAFDSVLSMTTRTRLSQFLGSAGHVFVLRKRA